MGTKRKKSQKNAAFKKVKLKIGKTLRKTNTTDSTVQTKKVVLLTQLEEQSTASSAFSYRGLSLDNLCTQLGHYSKNVRKNAIVGSKQILSAAPHLIEAHLRTIIPAFARLIAITDTDSQTHSQLKSLLELVCTVPAQAMSPHFALFVAHILRGLTHAHESVRSFALTVLHILLDRYPSLCCESPDIFQTLVHFISAGKKTSQSTRAMLEFIASFLRIYDTVSGEKRETVEVTVSVVDGRVVVSPAPVDLHPVPENRDPFYMPVASASSSAGPRDGGRSALFASPEALLTLTQALSTLVARMVLDDDRNLNEVIARILGMMQRGLERQQNTFMMTDFEQRYAKATEPLRKALRVRRNNRKLSEAGGWLLTRGEP